MNRASAIEKRFILFLIMCIMVALLWVNKACAASSSLSGDTTAKAGDTVYVLMSFSGSDTVAVGVIYSYNSCISSVSAGNASPWGSCETDTNSIGVGDYNGYESGSWNYILNGTSSVVSFRVTIANDAKPGDVAKLSLTTVYYATTSNTLDQVKSQNLPTAGTASISITIVGDEGDNVEAPAEPTATPTPVDKTTTEPTETTATPTPVDKTTTVPAGEDTAVDNVEPTPTETPDIDDVGDGSFDGFLDTSPIVPGDVISTIDDNYYDSATGGYVIAATKDDRGKTTIYEVVSGEDGENVYIKEVVGETGYKSEEVISESQMSQELSNTENYLADKEDSENYQETVSEYAADDETTAEGVQAADATEAAAANEANGFSYVRLIIVIAAILVIFTLLYFLVIRKYKEHKHKAHSHQ